MPGFRRSARAGRRNPQCHLVLLGHRRVLRFLGEDGADAWFWIHAAQAIVLTTLAIVAFRQLACTAKGEMHAEDESQRILMYLQDPLDRKIMVLRILEEMKWDDVAVLCERTERTVRLRFERARRYLRECVMREQHVTYNPAIYQQ